MLYAISTGAGRLDLGWRVIFGWLRWWLVPIFAGAAVWASMLPAAAQDALTGRVTHVRDGDTIVIGLLILAAPRV